MGVRVRVSRNVSFYMPFWVAIPVYIIAGMVWVLILVVWGLVLVVTAAGKGVAALSRRAGQPKAERQDQPLRVPQTRSITPGFEQGGEVIPDRQRPERDQVESDLARLRAEPPAPRPAGSFQASFVLQGRTYACEHDHRTRGAAEECGKRMAREKSRELGLEKPIFHIREELRERGGDREIGSRMSMAT